MDDARSGRKTVYKVSIGGDPDRKTIHLSHVFAVVSLGDGTFHQMQGFIHDYTLIDWMKHAEKTTGAGGRFTLDQMLSKLDQLLHLQQCQDAWSKRCNADYLELFMVDIGKKIEAGELPKWSADDYAIKFVGMEEMCVYV
ncbi:hypothetical protein TeGR_g4342 [Tetraparma gracilis]|uniref:Uncharacterized protein n=1 Tax=Tetraparma gracilis TaxID=2962635 RepID=A0ABQ6MFM9_9STRA|nr:hypothetical protein TeGR_g4342 [Tetraparma gracilis]